MTKRLTKIAEFATVTANGNWNDPVPIWQEEDSVVGSMARFWAELTEGTLTECYPRFCDNLGLVFDIPEFPENKELSKTSER